MNYKLSDNREKKNPKLENALQKFKTKIRKNPEILKDPSISTLIEKIDEKISYLEKNERKGESDD